MGRPWRNKYLLALLGYYLLIAVWWTWLNIAGKTGTLDSYIYGGAYAILALVGGIIGLYFSRAWGGWNSIMGKGIIFLALGLFGEAFGQLTWTFYNSIIQVEVPYPSIADIGYFSIIPFYALAMYNFAKASGAKLSLRAYLGKLQVVLIPLLMLTVSYFLFLRDYKFDLSSPVRLFLDFGYPMGEAITISIAILTFFLSRNFLGGVMKSRIQYIIFAFIVQYVTDYTFLYRVSRELYVNGDIVDLMYPTSFIIMCIGLFMLSRASVMQPITTYPKSQL